MKFELPELSLSSLPVSPQQYRLAGSIMLGIGVFCLVAGLIFIFLTRAQNHGGGSKLDISSKECVLKLQKLGFNPQAEHDLLRVNKEGLINGMALLAQSSQATSLCPNWALQNYCLGETCAIKGVSFTLKYTKK